ncbi:MAG: PEP/pyruvate-binding domain-containing protein [Candidatus Andersenbacteria bacterium]
MIFTKNFTELTKEDVALAGGKGASLGEMTQAGIPVPPGFVVTAEAFDEFLTITDLNVELDSILDNVDHSAIHTIEAASQKIQALITEADMPQDIADEVVAQHKKLGAQFVAVRSSATSEDSAQAAWAGQLDSYLNITEEKVLEHVQKCWASLFTPRAIFYRFEKGLHGESISVAVVVQKMVESETSGIAFSVHPVTQDYDQLIIESGFGLGEAIVSGSITPDSYVVEKSNWNILDKNITTQDRGIFRKGQEGNQWQDIPEARGKQSTLTDEEVLELAKLVVSIEKHYGFPVDVEWASENNTFYIVQSRPITTLISKQKKEEAGGSLLQKFMTGLERDSFYPLVPVTVLAAGAGGFTPNFGEKIEDLNIKFLIAMKEGEAFVLMSETRYNIISEHFFVDYVNNQDVLFATISLLDDLEVQIGAIYSDLSYAKVASLDEEELLEKLEKIINDVRQYNCTAWFSTQFDQSLVSNFIRENNLEVNQDMVKKIWEKAITPVDDSFDKRKHEIILQLILESVSAEEIAQRMQYAYSGYTEVKSIEEIEQVLKEEYADYFESKKKIKNELNKEAQALRQRKEYFREWRGALTADEKLIVDYIQTIIVLRDKRKDVIGKGLVVNFRVGESIFTKLNIPKELLYYCAFEEFLKGSSYFEEKRVEILARPKGVLFLHDYNGAIEFQYDDFEETKKAMEETYMNSQKKHGEVIEGQIAYPGSVRGVVKVVLRPSEFNKFKEGEVLVTSMTRPEFVPLMKKASAIVTDEGGITSHAAIISREMKKPCVIGTKIATRRLKDGDEVEVDANNGVVKLL